MSKPSDSQDTGLEEQLREALIALEQATARERQTRLESKFLLESLRDLGFAERTSEVYGRSLELLQQSIAFDDAFLLRAAFAGEPLEAVAATSDLFKSITFAMGPHFERVKAGAAIPVYDISAMQEWADQPADVGARVVSTLSIPVPQEIGATIIVCTSAKKGAFNAASVQAAQRFGLLVSQALRMTRVREDELQTALVRLSSQAERDQTDFMLAAVDALGEGVFVVDAQQRIIVTNERYRQLYRELADMYVPGINIEDVWQLERQSGFVSLVDVPEATSINAEAGWLGTTRTNRHQLRDGTTIRATDRLLPNGWLVGVRVDISELAEKERDLTLARNEAQAANAVKTEFLATVSHEIRTPLNAILGMLGLIQSDDLSHSQQEYVSVAETSARNLLMLLNDILDVSKMEAGKLALEDEDVILAQIVRDVVRLYRDAAQAKGIGLVPVLDPALPAGVRADAGRLRQVLINFVSNAIKFTDQGQVKIVIEPAPAPASDENHVRLRFSVEDSGAGISEEAQKRLFQPFEQVGASVERRQGGTGLGLNICQRIAEAMNGQTGARSVLGEGSTFWLEAEFPVAEIAPSALQSSPLDAPATRPKRAGRSLRLLFADDSPSNQLLIRAMLTPTGHQIDMVSNGLEAVRALETMPYDIAFLDISMPEMDGREALAATLHRQQAGQLARQEINPRIAPLPIIAITANVMEGDREQYLKDGFAEVLAKPFSEEDLLHAIALYAPKTSEHARMETSSARPSARDADAVTGTGTDSGTDMAADFSTAQEQVDLDTLHRLIQNFGAEFFATSVAIFSDEMNSRIGVLETAISGGEDVRREAHAIKGSAASYGLTSLSASAARLEHNPDILADTLPALRAQWAHAKAIMEALCEST
ncbi:MAG: response regulator [Alphaproteobacteria bacterium TMED89]|nr:hypothetical protein [Rhodospirillaceae bacterium]RPH13224.1 MAG: response regulator [Alphaproteobacteria bacterium TMED89]